MKITEQNAVLWGDDIPYLYGLRQKGLTAFNKQGFPNSKNESWKYSYFKEEELSNPKIDDTPHECDGHCHEQSKLPFAAYQIHFCNGKLTTEDFDLPQGISVKPLAEAIFDNDIKQYLNKSFELDDFPFAALNTAFLEQGIVLVAERGAVADKPIYIKYHQHNDVNRLINIRNIMIIEKQAKLEIIEHFDGEDGTQCFNNVVNEIYVGVDSELNYYKWQQEAFDTHHITLNCVNIKENGKFKAFYALNECKQARSESKIMLLQRGATAEVNGIYRLTKCGKSDITTNMQHKSEQTYSNQLVKGVIDGKAKGIFQGQIHIAPDAQQTQGYQLHKALLLSDDGEVNCKPELEIFADDVKCSHGATCGDLDEEQLFYMQARGIPLEEARRILVEAYLNEALDKISNSEIKEWIKSGF